MENRHWKPETRRFVFFAMATMGVTNYSLLGPDTICGTDANGEPITLTTAQLKTDLFGNAFNGAQSTNHQLKPKI